MDNEDYKTNSTDGSQVIPLLDLLKKGIVYEEAKDFTNSIYQNVYTWAKEAVEQIAIDSRKKDKNVKGKNTETSNVISFIGRRGTGKTSAMLSFQEALKEYSESRNDYKKEDIQFSKDANMENVRFFTLACIDAAALEETESVFTLVLANILSKIEEYHESGEHDVDSYLKRTLLQKLSDIYKDYTSLTVQKNETNIYSAFENLRNVASSQRIRMKFAQLVKECLQFFQEYDRDFVKESYLVIAIDDLDMAHYNERTAGRDSVNMRSYEIMREISKYFSIPGVIVLAAYNHTNLQRQCSGFFIGSNSNYYRQINSKVETLRSGETLAGEFLEKTFTSAYRLYMPSWKKWDYFNWNILIDIGADATLDDLFKPYRENGKYIFKIKDLLKILFAEKIGVYYDCEGKKRHFLEANSLRALNSMLYLLIGEDAIKSNHIGNLLIEKENRGDVFKRIMDDVYFRFINERLYLEEEKAFFYELLELQIDRRSERIVQKVAPRIEPLGRNKQLEIRLLLEEKNQERRMDGQIVKTMDNSEVAYSYAELLHCIYHMTRQEIRQGVKRESIFSKEFVACILHSYSVCLTKIYDQYHTVKMKIDRDLYIEYYRSLQYKKEDVLKKLSKHDKEKLESVDQNYQILKGVIGKTVFGFWTQYYFPCVNMVVNEKVLDDKKHALGALSNIRDTNFHVEFLSQKSSNIDDMLKKCIFLMSLYTDVIQWERIEIKCKKRRTGQVFDIIMEYDGEEIYFELTAFAKLSVLYPEYLCKMEKLLIEGFACQNNEERSVKQFKKEVCNKIKSYFHKLWNDYYDWDKSYGGMAFPIHNFDLMYNLIKHLFLEHKEKNAYTYVLKDGVAFLDEFLAMIQRMDNHLKKIDEFYCLSGNDSFSGKLLNSPFIKLLKEITANDKSKNFMGNYLDYIQSAVCNIANSEKPSDDQ